ncbi:hypothetical protein E3U55_07310 [Filobacillus milosensis]|uniref:YhaN AAA domain-containing protein n=1 Tax=Filobacillus milosensis TaxID=94137 RepID=A0A4Y8IT58_9BACI|nr:AAA family ATPase [Filobacillus milosensis]TFB22102.1 hypothetical protein E3U55_07310 [Filobacillus milosensis]
MKFKQLDIVSFGKWNREKIHLESGINIFHGANEAGKSSIRMFMTYILFGLKPEERERYTSKVDGQLGGRLILTHDNDEWVIERFSHQNRGQRAGYVNGQSTTDEKINQLLRGMDRHLFESIFSFQDRDLQAIRRYKSDDLGKVLFNVGLTGSDHMVELENSLIRKADSLFKKQGKKPPINEKLNELKNLNLDIEKTEKIEKEHQNLYQQVRDMENELNDLKYNEQQQREHTKYIEKLFQTKSSVVKHQILSNELEDLSHIKHFPKNGQQRFEQLKEKEILVNEKLNILNEDLKQISSTLDSLNKKSRLEFWQISIDEAKALVEEVSEISKNIKQLNEQRKEINYECQRLLKDLGLNFSLKELTELSLNNYTNERWKRLAQKWEELGNQKKSISRKHKAKSEELDHKDKFYQQIKQDMLNEDELNQLNETYEKLKMLEQKHELEKEFENELIHQQSTVSKISKFLGAAKFTLPLALLMITALYTIFLFSSSGVDYVIVSVLLLVSIFSFSILNQQHKRVKQSMNTSVKSKDHNQDVTAKLLQLRSDLETHNKKEKELNEVKNQIQVLQTTLNELETDLDIVEEEFHSIEQKIEQELHQYNFLEQFELFHWPNVFSSLQQAKHNAEMIMDLEKQLNDRQSRQNILKGQAKQIIHLYESSTSIQTELLWTFLKDLIDQEKTWQQQIKQNTDWLIDKQHEITKEQAAFEPYSQEKKSLFNQVNASSEEEFNKLCDDHQIYLSKQEQLKEAYSIVFEVFGDETNELINKHHNWADLEEQLEMNEINLSKIIDLMETKRNLISEKRAQISQLEENGRLSDLIHQRAQLESEIVDLAKEWAVVKTAQGYLKDTKNRYQNVYLPGIMEQTRKYFEKLTNGRYNEIIFSETEETISVKSSHGEWYHVHQLSEGTADQLYVSLRLALNDSIKRLVRVPFVFDDAFVHFDFERREQILKQLEEIAEEQQVIYLTFDQDSKLNAKDINQSIYVS